MGVILGIVIFSGGAMFGVAFMCLLTAASRADDEMEKEIQDVKHEI